MNDEIVKLAQRCKSNTHRIDSLEKNSRAILDMTVAVRELAIEIKNMKSEQKDLIERLSLIERKPREHFETIIKTALTCIVSTVMGVVLGNLLG
jgi:allophanate hydrolase subunit 1